RAWLARFLSRSLVPDPISVSPGLRSKKPCLLGLLVILSMRCSGSREAGHPKHGRPFLSDGLLYCSASLRDLRVSALKLPAPSNPPQSPQSAPPPTHIARNTAHYPS